MMHQDKSVQNLSKISAFLIFFFLLKPFVRTTWNISLCLSVSKVAL